MARVKNAGGGLGDEDPRPPPHLSAEAKGKAKKLTTVDTEFCPVPRTHVASQKGPLDRAGDPPSFSARVVNPTHSSRDVPVNLILQLIRRES